MKSRLIKAQNQRVERITTTTLVVGIDIAKENHAAQAINFRGIVLTNRAITFSNDRDGYKNVASTADTGRPCIIIQGSAAALIAFSGRSVQ